MRENARSDVIIVCKDLVEKDGYNTYMEKIAVKVNKSKVSLDEWIFVWIFFINH